MQNYAPELLVVVMTPCMILWDWLGNQLLAAGVNPNNLYYPFVTHMMDAHGVQRFNDFIDFLAPKYVIFIG